MVLPEDGGGSKIGVSNGTLVNGNKDYYIESPPKKADLTWVKQIR